MRESRNHFKLFNLAAVLIWLTLAVPSYADHGREIRPTSWQQDATVRDTFWIDDEHGWAVGDQGLILRTTDGGENWTTAKGAGLDLDDHRSLRQKISKMRPISRTHELIPLTCSFTSVHFHNKKRGWIAGNYYTPYLDSSRSVVLTTNDGGITWSQIKGSILPEINRIHFQDLLGGWALGRSGNLFKTGVFSTSTGGNIWSVTDSDTSGNWIDGELTANGFVVIDDEGNLGRIRSGRYEAAVVYGDRPGFMRSVRMADSKIGWAVGSSGTVLHTTDGGQTWRRPTTSDRPVDETNPFAEFDFTSVTIAGDKVFFAGNPGTIIFEMEAATATELIAHDTNFSLPISKVFFSSPQQGCVVGSNGLIATSTDSGTTWYVKRSVEKRLAVLSVTQHPLDLPLACLATYASEQNRLVGNLILGQHDRMNLLLSASATHRIGAGAVIELRGEDTSQEIRSVDTERLQAELVRSIRTLRPSVLVCGQANRDLEAMCRNAVDAAASADSYPQQLTAAGLNTWQIDRLIIKRSNSRSDMQFIGNRYLPRTGCLLEDQIAISLGTLGHSPINAEAEYFDVESYTGSISARGNDIFFGLNSLGQTVPERTEPTKLGNLNSIATAPLKHSEMQRILDLETNTDQSKAEAQSQIQSFGSTQPSRESGIWLMQLAEKFLLRGDQEMAAYSLEQLVNRHSNHAFAPAALMWLAQHYSSDEVGAALWANHDKQAASQNLLKPETESLEAGIDTELEASEVLTASSIPVSELEDGVRTVAWQPEDRQQPAVDLNSIKAVRNWRVKTASHYLHRLKQSDLDFARSPDVQFMEAILSKKIPGDISNLNLLKKIKRTGEFGDAFRAAAGRELKTGEKKFRQQIQTCFLAATRPRLDGDVNDSIWQHAIESGEAKFMAVTEPDSDQPSYTDVCWLANDDEFLFLAARCNRIKKQTNPASAIHRQRDPDLSNSERIEFQFDFDRDLRSSFTFTVDSRGRAAESCCGATGWNPDWYVAAGQTEDAWFIECAIPLHELTVATINEDTIAAVAIRRLNSSSIDLWSDKKQRTATKSQLGIIAGLQVHTGQFQFIRLANPVSSDAETNVKGQLSANETATK